jgi:hypothetical protein
MVGNPARHCTRRSFNSVFLAGNSLRAKTDAKYISKVYKYKILFQNEVIRKQSGQASVKHLRNTENNGEIAGKE